MNLVQGHDTPLGHGQQLCEILSRSDKGARSYDPDKENGQTLTFTQSLTYTLTQPPMNSGITISPPMLLLGDKYGWYSCFRGVKMFPSFHELWSAYVNVDTMIPLNPVYV